MQRRGQSSKSPFKRGSRLKTKELTSKTPHFLHFDDTSSPSEKRSGRDEEAMRKIRWNRV